MKIVIGVVTALALAGSAVGSPTRSVSASGAGAIELTGAIEPGIAPGLSRAVSFTASNPGTSAVTVGTVRLVRVAVDPAHSGCDVADFTMADVIQNQSIPPGASNVALTRSGSLAFANTAANQDACKNARLTLTLSST